MVRRYDTYYPTFEHVTGEFVLYSDYAALKRECERLRTALETCVAEFEHLCDDGTLVREFVEKHPTMVKASAALQKARGGE